MRCSALKIILLVLSLVSICTVQASAQSSLASLRGSVRDASGAMIPGATLTLTEPATGSLVRTVVSDDSGSYEMPDLRPGTYRLEVALEGFKTFVSENVVLESGQTRRVDARLEVGGTQEEVTVVAGAQVLTTDTGEISGRFNAEEYQKSAFVDVFPSPFAMFSTQPGVQGSGWGVVVAGQPREQMVEAMDGVHSRRQGNTNNTNFMEEVSVNIVNAPADSSRVTSYDMVSKRGQNEFRGMAYYEHFNSALNARPFFESDEVPFLLHEWQLELGGPVLRNKTFFYGSWAAQRVPKGSFNLATVPTSEMRRGDFSNVGEPIIDPLTGQPFPGNRIPGDRISPVAGAAQEHYIPLPNRGGEALSNNFEWVHPYHWDYFKGDWPFVRIDHNLTEQNTLTGRWMKGRWPYVLVTDLPDFFWSRLRNQQRAVLADTHVFSPAVVHTIRFGYNHDFIEDGREFDGQLPINGADAIATLGLQGVNPDGYSTAGFPEINITGFSELSTITGGVKSDDRDLTLEESLTWTTGRHVWKFGWQYLTFEGFSGVVPNYGTFTFNGEITGHPYADFLLGFPFESERVLHPLVNRRQTAKELGIYVQDSFKVSANLTLDYGLRWDYFPAARYEDGLMYNWDKASGAVIVPPEALGAVSALYPDTIEVRGGDVLAEPDIGNLRPRVSLAYRLNERTVIRGGYGAFTERLDYFVGAQGGGPFESGESYQNILQPGERPLFAFPNPFPGLEFASVPSQSVSSYPLQTDNGTIHQFNVSVERELMPRVGLRVSYIGSRSVGLNYVLDNINKPEPSATPFTTDRRPWPEFVDIEEIRSDGSARYDAFQAQVQKRAGAFTFNAHYTWARDQGDYLNEENPYDVTDHWFNASETRRHYAMVNTNWELPFGRGKPLLADVSPLVDQLVGGWTVSTVSYFGTGTFFTPEFSGADPSNTGTSGGIPDRIGPGNLPSDQREPMRWFNPDDFAVPSDGRFGNAGVNILEADGLHVHHLSLSKESRLAGSMSMTFTITASNIFNHAHFTNPAADISTATAGTISGVMSDFQSERAGRRMVTLKGILRF